MAFETRGLEFIQCYSNLELMQDLSYSFNDGVLDRMGRVHDDEIHP